MSLLQSCAALFVVALGYGVLVPLAPTLLQASMGAMSVESLSLHTGALSATYLLSFAALAPVWGRMTDSGARDHAAAAGLAGFAASFGTLALSGRLEMMYVSLAVAGISAGAVVPAVQVRLARIEGDEGRARLLSVLGAASFAGWFLGPPLAAWSIARGTLGGVPADRAALALVALLGAAAAVLALHPGSCRANAGAAPPEEPTRDAGREALIFAMLAMAVTFGIGDFEVSIVLWVVQVLRLEPSVVSRMLIECTVVMMIVQAAIFLLPAARPGWKPRIAAAAFGAMGVAIAAMPLATPLWGGFLAVAVIAASATLLQTMLSLGTVAASQSRAGAALGLQLSLSSLGQGLGSLAAGSLFSSSGRGFFLAGAVLAVAGLSSLALRR